MSGGLPGSKLLLVASGAAVGLCYGLMLRLGAQVILRGRLLPIMSIGFLFLLPFAMGFVSVFIVENAASRSQRGFGLYCRCCPWVERWRQPWRPFGKDSYAW
jgi:hypothetical protein